MDKRKWQVLSSDLVGDFDIFKVRRDVCRMPNGKVFDGYHVGEFPHWVNIVALTAEGELILIEQYRHACGEVVLEIPAGILDEGEDPKKAALRELKEETGYVADDFRLLAKMRPNPGMQNNYLYTYLATGCAKVSEQDLNPNRHLISIEHLPAPSRPEILLAA